MQIGHFSLELDFCPVVTLAEAAFGAPLLRAVRVANLRGGPGDWLKLKGTLGGCRLPEVSIRGLSPGETADVGPVQAKLMKNLRVPPSLAPGTHAGEIIVSSSSGQKSAFSFSLQVLPASLIPTDFARARYLAAWVQQTDEARAFAAEALGSLTPAECPPFRAADLLYEALAARGLAYQPVPTTILANHQQISDLSYCLLRGGSCADLSLAFASLLLARGYFPALMLYGTHMTAGCFSGLQPPAFETLSDSAAIRALVDSGALRLSEITGVCQGRRLSTREAAQAALNTLESGAPGVLINVTGILRTGQIQPLSAPPAARPRCPFCGCDFYLPPAGETSYVCPACGNVVTRLPAAPAPAAPPPEPVQVEPGVFRFRLRPGGAAVTRLLAPDRAAVSLPTHWQGRKVTAIEARAFQGASFSEIELPSSIAEIGDRAFAGCKNLRGVALPPETRTLGFGAFADSGLSEILLPPEIRAIPRMAFSGCASLRAVTLPEGLTAIGERAFSDCPCLLAVCIPASVKRISASAFDHACQLTLLSPDTVIG